MTFLPIVERELRVAARRPDTYRTRFLAALIVALVWMVLLGTGRSVPKAQLSQMLFLAMGALALGFAMLAGVFLTADCLSEEKREETLGLLFLTDLRSYDVVLGKLAATSLRSVYGLLAIFPVLALPILLGGVTEGAYWRMVLVLLVALFLSLSLGMFVSALSCQAREAMAGTFLGMVFLAGIAPAAHWLQIIAFHRVWTNLLLLPSPGFAFISALDSHYASAAGQRLFWNSVQTMGWLGVGFLALATWLLPRGLQGKNRFHAAVGCGEPSPPGYDSRGATSPKPRALNTNPFLWLASRRLGFGKRGRTLLQALFGIWLCFFILSIVAKNHVQAFIVALFAAFGLHQVFKCLVAMEATRQLSEDRQSGALELLLVSPLTEAEILDGQSRALRRHFAGWVWLLALVNLGLAAAAALCAERLQIRPRGDAVVFVELFLGGMLALAADFRALSTVGIWLALRADRHHRAVLGALGRILPAPWVALLPVIFLSMGPGLTMDRLGLMLAFWFLLGIALDAVMASIARRQLKRGFRAVLAASGVTSARPPGVLRPGRY